MPQGRIHLVIDSTFESAQAEQAADHMRSNQAHGKIVPTMP
ncbi:zinc-binding dehydrogenase [Actinopolyspora sp. BKK1]|nr:zinc-binding dehydrogenase [Actinopolyspora sp. BKK2]NHE76479.1 zinc-binding dehydrogenase [Actinopolyspora sp. BKK1]